MLVILTYLKYVPVPALLLPSLTAARYKSAHPLRASAVMA
jgi:hypothetical protein